MGRTIYTMQNLQHLANVMNAVHGIAPITEDSAAWLDVTHAQPSP